MTRRKAVLKILTSVVLWIVALWVIIGIGHLLPNEAWPMFPYAMTSVIILMGGLVVTVCYIRDIVITMGWYIPE